MNKIPKRPVYLNLAEIRLPVTAVVSILHRVAGAGWLLCLPLLVFLLERSLQSEVGYRQVLSWLQPLWIKWLLLLGLWFLAHHFLAGIRFLLVDFDIGMTKTGARLSAWWVHAMALVATVILARAIL